MTTAILKGFATCMLACLCIQYTAGEVLLVADKRYVMKIDDVHLNATVLPRRSFAYYYAVDWHRDSHDVYYTSVHPYSTAVYKYTNSEQEVGVLQDTGVSAGIAVDWVHDNLYYVDESDDTINVLSLTTGARKTLYSGEVTDIPRAIRVDPRDDQRYIYWSDWGNDAHIRRCGLDGEDCEMIVDTDIRWPNSISIDYENDKLYWVDTHSSIQKLYRSELDGSDRVVMINLAGNMRGIDVLGSEKIYLTEEGTGKIFILTCHGGRCSTERTLSGLRNPKDIQIMNNRRQPLASDVCAGLQCPLCLPASADTPGYDWTCFDEQGAQMDVTCSANRDYCLNGGSCMYSNSRISCDCPEGWEGRRCEQRNLVVVV